MTASQRSVCRQCASWIPSGATAERRLLDEGDVRGLKSYGRYRCTAAGSTNAQLRTTTALTILNAGNKENVLPGLWISGIAVLTTDRAEI